MIHPLSEIAASDVVEIRQARPATHIHPPAGPSDERAGQPLNSIGFIYPSDPPRSQRDHLTVIALSLIVVTCAVGIAVADVVFR